MSVALVAIGLCCFTGCARKMPEPEFRPLQIRWIASPGEDENSMANKDLCVIRLTSKLMGEPLVQASTAEEIYYDVVFAKSKKTAGTLEFTGVCADSVGANFPECRWHADCDEDGVVVVKFNNGD